MAVKKKTTKRKTSRKTTVKKKTVKRKTVKRKAVKRKAVKRTRKKPAFGGYAISFAGCDDTLEQVFGKKPIPPSEMTKKIWVFIKANHLSTS